MIKDEALSQNQIEVLKLSILCLKSFHQKQTLIYFLIINDLKYIQIKLIRIKFDKYQELNISFRKHLQIEN